MTEYFGGQIAALARIDIATQARSTDRKAQLFTLFRPASGVVKNVGDATVIQKAAVAYLWNGTGSDVTINSFSQSGTEVLTVSGLSLPDDILAGGLLGLTITAGTSGPEEIAVDFDFDTSCVFDPGLTIIGWRNPLIPELVFFPQPRGIDLSSAMEEAYSYFQGVETYYDTLEFISSMSTEKVMVVHSDENLATPQGTFIACNFDCQLPETEGAVRGQMQITVDFLPREAQAWIRRASQARAVITVKWRQYLGSGIEPDAEYPMPLEIIGVEQTPTGVTATALFPDLVNMPFPRRLMTTKELPGGIV